MAGCTEICRGVRSCRLSLSSTRKEERVRPPEARPWRRPSAAQAAAPPDHQGARWGQLRQRSSHFPARRQLERSSDSLTPLGSDTPGRSAGRSSTSGRSADRPIENLNRPAPLWPASNPWRRQGSEAEGREWSRRPSRHRCPPERRDYPHTRSTDPGSRPR